MRKSLYKYNSKSATENLSLYAPSAYDGLHVMAESEGSLEVDNDKYFSSKLIRLFYSSTLTMLSGKI